MEKRLINLFVEINNNRWWKLSVEEFENFNIFLYFAAMTSIEEIYSHFLVSSAISTDTRSILPNSIFFALKGPTFNGNKFAIKALSSGASFAIVDEPEYQLNDQCLLVPDCLTALQQLASYHRQQLKIPFLAITGSNGKTTTKELVRNVLSKKFNVHATKGNLNNHIGVPLTILSIPKNAAFVVIEMGANHQKEIEQLCEIANPDFGLITNVGKAHLEGFGGFEGVKKGKGELYAYLKKKKKTVFVNADNHILQTMIEINQPLNVVSYGTKENCFCSGELIHSEPTIQLTWKCGGAFATIETQMIGAYNFENILSAIAIGNYFKVKPEDISEAIAFYVPDNSRSQVIRDGSNTIILDAYNANPTSMEAALINFNKMNSDSKYICIGDMAELGEESEAEHKKIIELLKAIDYKQLILVGKNFGSFADQIACMHFDNSQLASAYFKKNHPENSYILIKGSRSSRMELLFDN